MREYVRRVHVKPDDIAEAMRRSGNVTFFEFPKDGVTVPCEITYRWEAQP